MEMTKNSADLKELIEGNRLHIGSIEIKAAYMFRGGNDAFPLKPT